MAGRHCASAEWLGKMKRVFPQMLAHWRFEGYKVGWGGLVTKVARPWVEQEFAGLNLGNARLNKKAKKLMGRFSANPVARIPDACDSLSKTEALQLSIFGRLKRAIYSGGLVRD